MNTKWKGPKECSWCRKQEPAEPGHEHLKVSHGCCRGCRDRVLAELRSGKPVSA